MAAVHPYQRHQPRHRRRRQYHHWHSNRRRRHHHHHLPQSQRTIKGNRRQRPIKAKSIRAHRQAIWVAICWMYLAAMEAIATAATVQKRRQAAAVAKAAANLLAKVADHRLRQRQKAHQKSNANQNIQNRHEITAKTRHQPITMHRQVNPYWIFLFYYFD